jgi:HK97 family phage portal protein
MNLFGLEIGWARKSTGSMDINTVIRRFEEVHAVSSGIALNPDLAMQSPTMQAIVQAISRRISTLPLQVLKKTTVNGRVVEQPQPDHPLTALLAKPNEVHNPSKFWLDATSWLVRWGNFYCWKGQGLTGPVRRLIPLHPGSVTIVESMTDPLAITYRVSFRNGQQQEYQPSQILHARGPARDGIRGDSPVMDVREAIALEIAAEKMGGSVFGNNAMPGIIFNYAPGSQGFKTDEEAQKFVQRIQDVFAKKGRFKSLLLPKGIETGDPIPVENEKAQFLQTRMYQRTVIAGAFGVPPHLVGDLSKGTFRNVEEQNTSFVQNAVAPFCTYFEAAVEQSLLTDEDRANGVIIRFDIDGALRADFKTRQEGLKIQREMGVLNADEWREEEGRNPIPDGSGRIYWTKGPSGQGADNDSSESVDDQPSQAEEEEEEGGQDQ